jgi:hypothetical protein
VSAVLNIIFEFLLIWFHSWVNDREEYNRNLAQCRADEDAFRAYARQIQDEMLATLASDDAEGVPGEV